MVEWFVKRFVCKRVNALLQDKKQSVGVLRTQLKTWCLRLQGLLSCVESLIEKIEDDKLTAEELKAAGAEISKVVKEW